MTARRPFWLAEPSRFAALRASPARWALAALALLVALLCAAALGTPEPLALESASAATAD